jgi:hypothetical protein
MAGLSDNKQAIVMAIAFALAGIGTIALPTGWPFEVRLIPSLVAALFAGVKEYLGGAAPAAGKTPTPASPQTGRRIAAVLTPAEEEHLNRKGYVTVGLADVDKKTYILLEQSVKS